VGDTEDATHVAGLAESAKVQTRLTLEVGERTIGFPRDKSVLILGRENTCDIVVQERPPRACTPASSARACNTCWSTSPPTAPMSRSRATAKVLLRRDSVMLRGRGKFALGTSTDTAVVLIQFDCS